MTATLLTICNCMSSCLQQDDQPLLCNDEAHHPALSLTHSPAGARSQAAHQGPARGHVACVCAPACLRPRHPSQPCPRHALRPPSRWGSSCPRQTQHHDVAGSGQGDNGRGEGNRRFHCTVVDLGESHVRHRMANMNPLPFPKHDPSLPSTCHHIPTDNTTVGSQQGLPRNYNYCHYRQAWSHPGHTHTNPHRLTHLAPPLALHDWLLCRQGLLLVHILLRVPLLITAALTARCCTPLSGSGLPLGPLCRLALSLCKLQTCVRATLNIFCQGTMVM
jgi:hypothetical protein